MGCIDGVEGEELPVGASTDEVMSSIHSSLGGSSIVVERYRSEYYFLDIMGEVNDVKVNLMYCENSDESQVCTSELLDANMHVHDTATTLGGSFSLQYPILDRDSCKTCRHSTGRLSVFATAAEVEVALEELSLVSDVDVTITESSDVGTYKVPVQSGIVGTCRNFYIHFLQHELSPSPSIHDDDIISYSTYFAGDLPLLIINQDNVKGTPTTTAAAFSEEYNALVTEIVKGADFNHYGSVDLSISINGGVDFSTRNARFDYNAIPIVKSVSPSYGTTTGGTLISVFGNNLSKASAQSCLFWTSDASFTAVSPVLHYGEAEVSCLVPAAMKNELVYVSILGSEGMKQFNPLDSSWKRRAGNFYYHDPIEITYVVPNTANTRGGTNVTIQGGPFFPLDTLSCVFGAELYQHNL